MSDVILDSRHPKVEEVLAAFGFKDVTNITSFSFSIDAGKTARVTLTRLVTYEEAEALREVLQTFELREKTE